MYIFAVVILAALCHSGHSEVEYKTDIGPGEGFGKLSAPESGGVRGDFGYKADIFNDDRGKLVGQAQGTRVLGGPYGDTTSYGGSLDWTRGGANAALGVEHIRGLGNQIDVTGGYKYQKDNTDFTAGAFYTQGPGYRDHGVMADFTHRFRRDVNYETKIGPGTGFGKLSAPETGGLRGDLGYKANIFDDSRGKLVGQAQGSRVLGGPNGDRSSYGGSLDWTRGGANAGLGVEHTRGLGNQFDANAGYKYQRGNTDFTAGGFFTQGGGRRDHGFRANLNHRFRREVKYETKVGPGTGFGELSAPETGGLRGDLGYKAVIFDDNRGKMTGQAEASRVLGGPYGDVSSYGAKVDWTKDGANAKAAVEHIRGFGSLYDASAGYKWQNSKKDTDFTAGAFYNRGPHGMRDYGMRAEVSSNF